MFKNEVEQYSEPIEVRTQAKPKPIKMQEPPRQLTATELLQQSYNEMKRLKQQEKPANIDRFKFQYALINNIFNNIIYYYVYYEYV